MSAEQIRRILLNSALSDGGSASQLIDELVDISELRTVDTGEVLMTAGNEVKHVFVVGAGRLRVRDLEGSDLAHLGPGDLVGEIGLIDRGPSSAGVVALRACLLVAIPVEPALKLLLGSPTELLRVAKIVAGRVRRANLGRDADPPRLVAVTGGIGSEDMRSSLAQITGGTVVCGDDLASELKAELNGVVVSDGVGSQRPDVEVVLIGPGHSCRPSTTAARVVELGVRRSRHPNGHIPLGLGADFRLWVDPSDPESIKRTARLVIGGASVLVLSGGGARAAAHVGVVDELKSAGIQFDALVGVSAGAAVATGLAAGWSVDRVRTVVHEWGKGINWGRDFGPTAQALTTGKTLTAASRQQFAGLMLEDLEVPCVLAATSLVHGKLVALTAGDAWRAVRASSSLPAISPPVRRGDDVLVDGGVADNLPTSLCHTMFPKPTVFAVDVGRAANLGDPEAFSEDGIAHRREILADRQLLPRVMASLVMSTPRSPRCDHLIRPRTEDLSVSDTRDFDTAVERGRTAARAWLANEGPVESSD